MANKKVTDLDPITTAPISGVMHFVDTTDSTQNAAGSSFKVTKSDFLKENTAAIALNTAKVSFDSAASTRLANTSGTNTGDQDLTTYAKITDIPFIDNDFPDWIYPVLDVDGKFLFGVEKDGNFKVAKFRQLDVVSTVANNANTNANTAINLFNNANNYIEQNNVFNTNNISAHALDSLTDGAGGSTYRTYFTQRWKGLFRNSEMGLQFIENLDAAQAGTIWGKSGGWIEMTSQADFSISPMKYSACGKGLYITSGSNSFVDWTPINAWETVDLYYLQQPTGGTFNYRNASSTNQIAVNTLGAFEVKKVTLTKDLAQNNRVNINSANGNIALFGFWFKATGSGNSSNINLSRGGMETRKIADLDSATQKYWFGQFKANVLILDGGMNDRNTVTAANFKTMIRNYIRNVRANSPETHIVLINPNQSSDYATTNLPAFAVARNELALEEGVQVVDIPTVFGNYATFVANGWMLDTIHPNDIFNRLKAKHYMKVVGINPIGNYKT